MVILRSQNDMNKITDFCDDFNQIESFNLSFMRILDSPGKRLPSPSALTLGPIARR